MQIVKKLLTGYRQDQIRYPVSGSDAIAGILTSFIPYIFRFDV